MQEFAARLQALREGRQMSCKTLGELVGLSKNMIGMYERGEKEPKLTTLKKLAGFFGVTVDYLCGNDPFK